MSQEILARLLICDLANFLMVAKFNLMHAHIIMTLSIQIVKFKFHQYQIRAISPKLPAIRYIMVIRMYVQCIVIPGIHDPSVITK